VSLFMSTYTVIDYHSAFCECSSITGHHSTCKKCKTIVSLIIHKSVYTTNIEHTVETKPNTRNKKQDI